MRMTGSLRRGLRIGGVLSAALVMAGAAAAPASACEIRKADFERLDMGMDLAEVVAILKCEPVAVTAGGWAGSSSQLYRWPMPGRSMFLMGLFVEGRLLNYSQDGLD